MSGSGSAPAPDGGSGQQAVDSTALPSGPPGGDTLSLPSGPPGGDTLSLPFPGFPSFFLGGKVPIPTDGSAVGSLSGTDGSAVGSLSGTDGSAVGSLSGTDGSAGPAFGHRTVAACR